MPQSRISSHKSNQMQLHFSLIECGNSLLPVVAAFLNRSSCDHAGLNLCDMDNLPFLWHKGKDFWLAREKGSDQGNPIPLIFRMATVDDKKGATVVKTSRHLWRGRVCLSFMASTPQQLKSYCCAVALHLAVIIFFDHLHCWLP